MKIEYIRMVCVRAFTKELKSKTGQILKTLNSAGISIKIDKCKLICDKLSSYLGYHISKDGISPNEKLKKKSHKFQHQETKYTNLFFFFFFFFFFF